MKKYNRLIFTASLTAASFLAADAVPAFPGATLFMQPDGSEIELRLLGDEFGHVTVDASGRAVIQDARGYWVPAGEDAFRTLRRSSRRRIGSQGGVTTFPRTGEVRSLVILVDFPDINFVTPDVHREFSEMLNLPGFDRREHIGSAADYFRAQSMGQFSPSFDVYGPVRADRYATYYGENDANGDDMRAHELVMEVCRKLDGEIDFSQYDLDGDGKIDNVYLFYAGYGENFAGNKASWIWPHANHIDLLGVPEADRTYDGKILNSYGCCAELYGSTGADVTSIGTFCHEFGHILGLPDTYDVNYSVDGSGNHPDRWDIMASGSYLPETRNCGAVPAGYTALERWLLGWADPVEISKPQNVTLPALQQTGVSARISTADPDEFFLLENRQQTPGSYDRYIPYHGMLVWHVDRRKNANITVTINDMLRTISCADAWNLEYNAVNMNAQHQCLEIEKASGNDGSKSSQDTPFPGRQMRTEFTDATSPAMTSWNGQPTGKPVTDIRELSGEVSFCFMGGSDRTVKVIPSEPDGIGENGFTARWEGCPDADDGYRLRLYRASKELLEGMLTIDETFQALPQGWTLDGEASYSGGCIELGGNAGAASISTIPVDCSTGGQLVVRARQCGTSASTLTVKCGDTVIDQYLPTDVASNYTITLPVSEGEAVLSFQTERRKPVAIERISLSQDVEKTTLTVLPDYTADLPADAVAHKIEGLDKDTSYAYTVEARGYAGSASELVHVTTTGQSEIIDIDTDSEEASASAGEYYRLDGIRVGSSRPVQPGIYIMRNGTETQKIIVR